MKNYTVYLIISILFFVFGTYDFLEYIAFFKNSNVTQGEIVKLEYYWQDEGTRTSRYIYSFSIDSTIFHGSIYNGALFVSSYYVGEKVKIRYNARNNSESRVDDFINSYYPLCSCLFISAISVFFWYKYRKRDLAK